MQYSRPSVVWFDVGDLLGWRSRNVTGIQRVMASIALEFLRLQAAGAPIRFCQFMIELGFVEVSSKTVQTAVERLLGEAIEQQSDAKAPGGQDRPGSKPNRRQQLVGTAKRALGGSLRNVYPPLSRLMEPRSSETPSSIIARLRRLGRNVELRILRRALRADKIFRAEDVLLNVGSSWQRRGYPGALNAIKHKHALRYVVLIHDLIPWRAPQYFTPELTAEFLEWAESTLPTADRILTTSQSTRRDFLAFKEAFDIPEKPISVVRLGRERPANLTNALPKELMKSPAGFVLCVGTVEVRKNHRLLIETWLKLLQRHDRDHVPALLWVGREGWMIDDLLAEIDRSNFIDGKLLWLGQQEGLPDSSLHGLYRACLFTMFPSHYEGWGLPVSESLAHGKLCIASSASSIPEVGGDLVDYHVPDDPDKCLALAERAIFDPSYRAAREERIRREFTMPDWAECAQNILEACRMAVDSTSRR